MAAVLSSLPHSIKSTDRFSCLLLFFLFSAPLLSTIASASSPIRPSYSQHCNSFVQESISNGLELDSSDFLRLQGAYFNGGHQIFSTSQRPNSSLDPNELRFYPDSIYKTQTEGTIQIHATLNLRDRLSYGILQNISTDRSNRLVDSERVHLDLHGFWSESAGKLCMVGTGSGVSNQGTLLRLSAVFKLNYPKASNISTSIVTGTVESTDPPANPNYFDPISILGYAQKTYSYSLVPETGSMCEGGDEGKEKSLSLEHGTNVCSMLLPFANQEFELDYRGDCSAGKCSPFDGGFLPNIMTVGGIRCSEKGKMHMYLRFSNSSFLRYFVPLIPETTLVGEGVWDEKNRLCFVACRLKNFKGSLTETSVEDHCSIGLSLQFPKVLSLKMRSNAIGSIWSKRQSNETGYFGPIGFRSAAGRRGRFNRLRSGVSGLEYNYTQLGRVRKLCPKKENKVSGQKFPDGSSFQDMRFDMSIKSTGDESGWGSASPLSIDQVFDDPFLPPVANYTTAVSDDRLLNVSYSMRFSFYSSKEMVISAEGMYDAETGMLCMVGCRYLDSGSKKSAKNVSMDCEILINVKFAPFNSETGQQLKGTIKSTRNKKDPLYMEPLEIVSDGIYGLESIETIWRMDLEMTMLLCSLTLACVFIGLQLFYVKKNPEVLPSISLLMLVILTLGHMIPLVLNFEAFFSRDHSRYLQWSNGWVEANEIVVRIVTMVAFLLQFRLLQLTFSARLAQGNKKGLWVAEKKALWLCLVLYLVGGLIALFVHWKKIEDPVAVSVSTLVAVGSEHSFWEDLRSFAGLILDGFLLPQILLNLFWNSNDKALALSFYVGTTVVRLVPHAYDAYRAHMRLPYMQASYIYANPDGDLYSAAWDVIIPCGGLVFAVLIYLQQRLGGAFFLPLRFRKSAEYEKVPVVG